MSNASSIIFKPKDIDNKKKYQSINIYKVWHDIPGKEDNAYREWNSIG
jgi:hypothetical protein